MDKLPSPETMLAYASILEKPQYLVKDGVRYVIPTGEIIEAACAALRYCASQPQQLQETLIEAGDDLYSAFCGCDETKGQTEALINYADASNVYHTKEL